MLNFQISEYDCAPTTFLNGLFFVLKRDEIPQKMIRVIYKNTLDCNLKIINYCGTSRKAMKKICKKINKISNNLNMDLRIQYLSKKKCTWESIRECLKEKGVAIIRSLLEVEHYYLITKIDDENIYIWDPYIIKNTSYFYNNVFKINEINNTLRQDYSFGPIKKREFILINIVKSK